MLHLLLAAAIAASPPLEEAAPQAAEEPRGLLVVIAHPDDEVFFAPAIARARRDGEPVTLILATSGDQGPGVTGMAKGAALAERRRGEALCSARTLGVEAQAVHFLELGDGTLADRPQDAGSPARQLVRALGPILAKGFYRTIITWGPDGGYGHGDHRMVSAITTQLVQAMAEGRPRLLYPGIARGSLPPVPQMQEWAVTDPALLTVAIAYDADDLAAARRSVQCHESQFSAEERSQLADLFDQTIWRGAVHFRPALAAGE